MVRNICAFDALFHIIVSCMMSINSECKRTMQTIDCFLQLVTKIVTNCLQKL